MSVTTKNMTYSIVWCRTSYNRYIDGVLTHAVANSKDGDWPEEKTLCGVKWTDSGWREVSSEDRPGCMRCAKALKKLDI